MKRNMKRLGISIVVLFSVLAIVPQAHATTKPKANISSLKGSYDCFDSYFNITGPVSTTVKDLLMVVDKKGKVQGTALIIVEDSNCDPDVTECETQRQITFSAKFGTPKLKGVITTASFKVTIDPTTKIALTVRGSSSVFHRVRYNSFSGQISLGRTSGSPVDTLSCSMDAVLK